VPEARPKDPRSLIAIVNDGAAAAGLTPGNYRPDGDERLGLDIPDARFDGLIAWLVGLDAQDDIRVEQIDLRRGAVPGLVNATTVLRRDDGMSVAHEASK
jgi:type II secretory pathway component PulM